MRNLLFYCLSFIIALGLVGCEKGEIETEANAQMAYSEPEQTTSFEGFAALKTKLPEDHFAYIPQNKADGKTYVWVSLSTRFIFLPKDHPQYDEFVDLLSESFAADKMLRVTIDEMPIDGDFPITNVEELSDAEQKDVERNLGKVLEYSDVKTISGDDLVKMTEDEIADYILEGGISNDAQKFPLSMSSLRNFHSAMANMTCSPANPFPCIPFQYAVDGCYSRAHEMKREYLSRMPGTCHKIFVFANQGTRLRAQTQVSCTQEWGWHVALLVQVSGYFYVVDPGLFTGPVSAYTWLTSLGDTRYMTVVSRPYSDYSPITTSSYYSDPQYSHTNYTNNLYSTRYGCSW